MKKTTLLIITLFATVAIVLTLAVIANTKKTNDVVSEDAQKVTEATTEPAVKEPERVQDERTSVPGGIVTSGSEDPTLPDGTPLRLVAEGDPYPIFATPDGDRYYFVSITVKDGEVLKTFLPEDEIDNLVTEPRLIESEVNDEVLSSEE